MLISDLAAGQITLEEAINKSKEQLKDIDLCYDLAGIYKLTQQYDLVQEQIKRGCALAKNEFDRIKCLSLGLTVPQSPRNLQKLVAECFKFFASEKHLRFVEEKEHDLSEWQLGNTLIHMQRPNDALKLATDLRSRNPTHSLVDDLFGKAYMSQENWGQATTSFNQAVTHFERLNTNDPHLTAYFELCYLNSLAVVDRDKCISLLTEKIKSSNHPALLVLLAHHKHLTGQYTESESLIAVAQESLSRYQGTIPKYENIPEVHLIFWKELGYASNLILGYNALNKVKQSEQKALIREGSGSAIKYFLQALLYITSEQEAYVALRTAIQSYINTSSNLEAFRFIKDLTEQNPKFSDLDFAYLDTFLEPSEEMVPPQEILEVLSKNKQLSDNLVPLTQSSFNEVSLNLACPGSQFEFVFKTNKPNYKLGEKDIERDFLISCAVHSLFTQYQNRSKNSNTIARPVKIVAPLYLVSKDNQKYMITKRKIEPNLNEVFYELSNTEKNRAMQMVFDTLALIHTLTTSRLKKTDNEYYIEIDAPTTKKIEIPSLNILHQVESRLLMNKSYDQFPRLSSLLGPLQFSDIQQFKHEYLEIVNTINSGPLFFVHGDAHLGNFFQCGTVFDFERACVSNPFIDVSLAVISSNMKFEKDDVIETYLSRLVNYTQKWDYVPDDTRKQFDACLLHNLYCCLGTGLSKGDKTSAYHILKTIKEYPWSIQSTMTCFADLIDVHKDRIKNYFDN